jgi:AraC-like DNA-binding protein
MFYREFAVQPLLRDYIQCIWVMQAEKGVFANADLLVPDGNIEVMLNYGDPITRFLPNGSTTQNKTGSELIGQRCGWYRHSTPGAVNLISVSFKPGGLSPFVPFAVADITAHAIPFSSLPGNLFTEMEERVYDENVLEKKIGIVQDKLVKQLLKNSDKSNNVSDFITRLQAINEFPSIAGFLQFYTINRRKLEREFDHYVGVSPKFLQRILRFRRAIAHFYRSNNRNLTALAYDCGYFDQAHFINDFKEFTGLSPKKFFSSTCTFGDLLTGEYESYQVPGTDTSNSWK